MLCQPGLEALLQLQELGPLVGREPVGQLLLLAVAMFGFGYLLGKIKIKGVPIDLSSIDIPVVFVSTVDDHIAPWQSTWNGAQLFSGPVKFILSGSGHIAGIVNPPEANKYGYRITASKLPKQAQA